MSIFFVNVSAKNPKPDDLVTTVYDVIENMIFKIILKICGPLSDLILKIHPILKN